LLWGIAVIADSAQFSAAVTELSDPAWVGTALTFQLSAGFLVTVISINVVPWLQVLGGWRWAFSILSLGPAVGILAMARLQREPRPAGRISAS
jgi:MFS family permease